MKYVRFNSFALFIIVIFIITLFSFPGCTGNSVDTIPPITFSLEPPPEITVKQLVSDFMADEDTAAEKYCGKRFLFSEIEVEEIFGRDYTDNHGLITYVQEYFMIGATKFKLRDFGIMQNLEEGFILNVVGEVRSYLKGFVYIEDCWVESIVGDLGTSNWEGIY
jgi:hypothetical protein